MLTSNLPRLLCRQRLLWRLSHPYRKCRSFSTHTAVKNLWPRLDVLPVNTIAPSAPVQLAGRRYLPGSEGEGFPAFLSPPRENLPLVVRVKLPHSLSLEAWAVYIREFIDENLSQFPAVMIKGLPFRNEADISALIRGLGYSLMKYVGGTSSRNVVDANLSTASNDPPPFTIEPHNEMSYSKIYPMKVIFSCSKPPVAAGESTLTDVREVTRSLDPKMVQKLEEKGISYMSFLPTRSPDTYTSWQERLLTLDKKEAEKSLQKLGYEFYWHADGGLSYWYTMPAVMYDPVSGEKIFFNQAGSAHSSYYRASPVFENQDLPDDRYPCHTRYGDGTEIEPEVLRHIRSVSWQCTVGLRWEQGDILVMDNRYIQHGRMGFQGERRILATLTQD